MRGFWNEDLQHYLTSGRIEISFQFSVGIQMLLLDLMYRKTKTMEMKIIPESKCWWNVRKMKIYFWKLRPYRYVLGIPCSMSRSLFPHSTSLSDGHVVETYHPLHILLPLGHWTWHSNLGMPSGWLRVSYWRSSLPAVCSGLRTLRIP